MEFLLGFEDNTNSLCCCCSVSKSNPTLCDSMDRSTAGFPVLHYLLSLLQLMPTESVMPSNHLILCRLLLLLPSIFPSIRVFSSESALPIRWPKYWSFSFSVSPSSEYSGLISLKSKGLSRVYSTPQFKSINSLALNLLYNPTPCMTTGKTIALTIQNFVSKNDVFDF